jgi:SAM-dependent methyltransferase
MIIEKIIDLPRRILNKILGKHPDYRLILYKELTKYVSGMKIKRILEIGPKDGIDTKRLMEMGADKLVLIDLPDKEKHMRDILQKPEFNGVEFYVGNIMYDSFETSLQGFDLIWFTGVLYHNPEQLRMIRVLYDLLSPGGALVLESATARRKTNRHENVVEIWHNVDKKTRRKFHVSENVSHLPSQKAIQSWLEMVGFVKIQPSKCHAACGKQMAATRGAFLATKPLVESNMRSYYKIKNLDYRIGKAN